MSNIEILSKIPLIIDIQEIHFDVKMVEKYDEKIQNIAIERSKKIFVYKIIYKSQGHKVVGYIVEPKEGENLPCIICNRGGSNEFGRIEEDHLFTRLIARFAENGYISIASQYSGNAGGEGKDEHGGSDIEDVMNLYKILKSYSRADIKRIGMYGASRGATMTYLMLARVKWLKAAVTSAGPTDLVRQSKERPEMKKVFIKMFGGSLQEMKNRSAQYFVDNFPKKVPILILHGTADWRVNPLDSLELVQKLLKLKIPYRLIMYEGGDHGLMEYRKESNAAIINWFDRYVKNGEKLPNLKPHGE